MRSWLRSAAVETQRDLMRSRREADEAGLEEAEEATTRSQLPRRRDALDDTDDEMPPLEADTTTTDEMSGSPVGGGGLYPSPAWFAFRREWPQCVPDYSCCLRYALSLGACCMPRDVLEHVPSVAWVQSRFRALHADEETLAFLRECDRRFYADGWLSGWGLRVGIMKPLLRKFMAHTDVNGMLGCGQMFLASAAQIRYLLQASIPKRLVGQPGIEWPWSTPGTSRPSRLLDVGAGDGHITSFVSRFFDETVATEVAAQMVKRLQARGFATIHTGDLDEGLPMDHPLVGEGFDCITLFNVIDRCSRPRSLLRQLRARLRRPAAAGDVNSARILLSVPLPLDPSVEVGTQWLDPEESILSSSRSARDFESSVCALADMLRGVGFDIQSVSRIPYLSQGDTWRPFYVLDASLWVLSARYEGQEEEDDDLTSQTAATTGHGHTHPRTPLESALALGVD